MRTRYGVAGLLLVLCSFFVFWVGAASGVSDPPFADDEDTTALSGALDLRDSNGSTNVTECPQAGLRDAKPAPLNHHAMDEAEKKSDAGNDVRVNQDYSCMPQDETALDVNPTSTKNIVAGANDYRLGWGTSGFYASTDNGEHWYDGITPFPSLPSGDNLDGGGDPVTVFDRGGVAYYAQINFNRTDDTSGVWVNRSTNGGFTWTRPCVAIQVHGPAERAVPLRRRGRPAHSGRRHRRIHPGQRLLAERERAGVRQGVDHRRAAAHGRLAHVLHAARTRGDDL